MAEGLNRTMHLGNLCADPELRYTQGGQAVLHIRLATTESYFDKKETKRVERTDFHNVVVWGKRGEALGKILGKGSSIFVEGSLRTTKYQDRDGNDRFKTEIVANNVILAGKGRSAPTDGADDGGQAPARHGGRQAPARGATPAPPPADDYDAGGGFGGDDDVPFVYIGAPPERDGIPRGWL